MEKKEDTSGLKDPLLTLLEFVPAVPSAEDVDPACMDAKEVVPESTGKGATRPGNVHGPLLAQDNRYLKTMDQMIGISGTSLMQILSEMGEQAYQLNEHATHTKEKMGDEIVSRRKPVVYISQETVKSLCGDPPGVVRVELKK